MNEIRKPDPDPDDFLSAYSTVENHLNSEAAFEGALFETFGAEEQHILSVPPACVWTVIEVDGKVWIVAGRHFVNHIGYLLTTIGWQRQSEEYLVE